MSFSLSNVEYWTSSSTWGQIPNVGALSSADQSAINDALTTLYNGSALAASMLDSWVGAGNNVRIAYAADHQPGVEYTTTAGKFVAYDLATDAQLYYFNDHGVLTHEKPELTVIHELSHMIGGTVDPSGTGPGSQPTEAEMNAAVFDYKGGAVADQNTVAAQLGDTDNIQASYAAANLSSAWTGAGFSLGGSYTEGNAIDVARIGDGGANDMDHSARTDASNDLFFGLAGDDTLNGGQGRDYLYGGDGDDALVAQGDNSRLDGGEGKDRLTSSGVADTLVGGHGDDLIDAAGTNPDVYTGSTMDFAAGDGHDKVVQREFTVDGSTFTTSGLDSIHITGASTSDLKLVWNYTVLEEHTASSDDFWYEDLKGDAVVKLDDTGDTIFFSGVQGQVWDNDHNGTWDSVSVGLPDVQAGGVSWDIAYADVIHASVAQYDVFG